MAGHAVPHMPDAPGKGTGICAAGDQAMQAGTSTSDHSHPGQW